MKTPKREKAKLWNAVAETANESLTWGEIECSRWKRKNKEAQLKRAERRKKRLEKLHGLYRARVSALEWEIKSSERDLEHEIMTSAFWVNRHNKLLFIAHGYCSASTCGQDIEGS